MYTDTDYKSRKAVVADVAAGKKVYCYQPGPFGPAARDGSCGLEGPHYPKPHSWYASAVLKDGYIVEITDGKKKVKLGTPSLTAQPEGF